MKLTPAIIAGVGMIGISIAISTQIRSYRFCGHKESVYDRYFPHLTYATECCVTGRLVSDLHGIYAGQAMYHSDHRHYAPSIVALQPKYLEASPRWSRDYNLDLVATGDDDWHCSVSKSARLPGYYLLTSDGTIYFSEDHPATLSDVVLSRSDSDR